MNPGLHSLDYLRKQKKQRSHGLELVDSSFGHMKTKATIIEFL